VEHRANELPAVGEVLPVRVGHGLANARHVVRIVRAPLLAQRGVVLARAAAGVLVADAGLRVVGCPAAHALEDIRARGDRLRPQRLGREGRGHLGGHDAGQPVGHRRLDELAAAERRDGRLAVGRDGGRRRHGRDGLHRRLRREAERDHEPRDHEREHHEQQRQQENFAHVCCLLSALRRRFAP